MKRTVDGAALVIGLVALLIASIALWAAVAPVPWAQLGAFVPLSLVVFGLIGLAASRTKH